MKSKDNVRRSGGLEILVDCLVGKGIETFGALVEMVVGAESVIVGTGTVEGRLDKVGIESILEGGIV